MIREICSVWNVLRLPLTLIYHVLVLTLNVIFLMIVRNADFSKWNKMYHDDFKYNRLFTWNLMFQIFYLVMSVLDDIIDIGKKIKIIRLDEQRLGLLKRLRNSYFVNLVFPLTIFVSAIFWLGYFIDQEIVMPKEFDNIIPPELNKVVYLTTLAFVLFEIQFIIAKLNAPFDPDISIITLVYALNVLSNLTMKYMTGEWVYPIAENLNSIKFITITLVLYAYLAIFYTLGLLIKFACTRTPVEEDIEKKPILV